MSRRVLITGAASGLGLELTRLFAARADRVLATDLREPGSDLADVIEAAKGRVEFFLLDVRDDTHWSNGRTWLDSHWEGLDVLVNNAGIASGGRIDRQTIDEWQRVVDINLLSVVRGCRTFTPQLKRQGSGQIVNIASLAGLVHPPGMSSYNAVKAGVVALSETLRHELEPFGISVCVACPSFFRSNLGASLVGDDPAFATAASKLIAKSSLTAAQIAQTVLAGVDSNRAVILTDRPGRNAYWSKRLLRPKYNRKMNEIARKLVDPRG